MSREFPILLVFAASALLISAAASAKTVYCFPKDADPQILRSPNVGDYHPDWAPPSGVGTGWSLTKLGRQGNFIKGILNTSHGNPTTGVIYVLASEWNCG